MSTATAERVETVEEWATRLAADLPPLPPEAIATVGRIAARLDARRAAAAQR